MIKRMTLEEHRYNLVEGIATWVPKNPMIGGTACLLVHCLSSEHILDRVFLNQEEEDYLSAAVQELYQEPSPVYCNDHVLRSRSEAIAVLDKAIELKCSVTPPAEAEVVAVTL